MTTKTSSTVICILAALSIGLFNVIPVWRGGRGIWKYIGYFFLIIGVAEIIKLVYKLSRRKK